MKETLRNVFEKRSGEYTELYLTHISIDCVVLGFHEGLLKILVLKLKEGSKWSLPGGYVGKEEDIDDAAIRILRERTGADHIFLKQFRTFGKNHRNEDIFEENSGLWMAQRFLSVGYYALIDFHKVNLSLDLAEITVIAEWKDVKNLPEMMMDHREIIDQALIYMRRGLNYYPIGLNLLPERFTMPELQQLYESILNKKLNRGNFYRKMMRYDILTKLDECRKIGAHKSPHLYRFNIDNYQKAMEEGFKESW